MTDEFTKIKLEKIDYTGKIILNSPETLNIIEKNTFVEINEALNRFESSDVKVVLITAFCGTSKKGKKVFSAGVDLKKYNEKIEMAKLSPERFKGELKAARGLLSKIEKYNKPVVIAIDGFITGGFFELALACDIILVSESALMSLNEVNIGLIPGYGGIHRLLRLFGRNRAMEIIATARQITAKEAFEMGLVSKVFKNREFNKKIHEYCSELATKPANAFYLVKNTLSRVLNGENIEEVEIENFLKAICSPEAEKSVEKFLKN